MKTKHVLFFLSMLASGLGSATAQSISGPIMPCPGETVTYYFFNGTTFSSSCKGVDFSVTLNGQVIASQHFDSPSNPTPYTFTFPNEPGQATITAVGFKCCLIKPFCAFDNATLNVNVGQFPSIGASAYALCPGGSTVLTATPNGPCTPQSYYWEAPAGWTFTANNSNILPAGPSQVTLVAPTSGTAGSINVITRANFGTGSTTYTSTILQFGPPDASEFSVQLVGGATTVCPNTSYTITVYGPPGTTYSNWAIYGTVSSWYPISDRIIVVNTVNNSGAFIQAEVYASNTCGSAHLLKLFYPGSCPTTFSAQTATVVFPNPTTSAGSLTATWPETEEVISVSLISPKGETLETVLPKTNKVEFDVSRLPEGDLYVIRINTKNGATYKRVLVKNK